MRESGYYPPGAEFDPDAPYNEVIIPEHDFDVYVSQTLSKSATVTTDKYIPEVDEEDGRTYYNTEDTDWKEVYDDNSYTPLQIINLCSIVLEHLMDQGVKRIGKINLKELHEACEGWEEDDYEVVEE